MKTILVTGCAGFIGSHLCEYLLNKEYLVIGIDNFNNYYDKSIKKQNLENLLPFDNFSFRNHCIGDRTALNNINQTIDGVIHLAATPGVVLSVTNIQQYLNNNVSNYNILLEFLASRSIKKILFASSSSIYGNQKVKSYTEDLTLQPLSPYGLTKQIGEQLNYQYHLLHQFDIINLRLFSVYGSRMRPDLAIAKFTKSMLLGESIDLFNEGMDFRDYTHISDVVNAFYAGLEYINSHSNCFEQINIGNNQPIQMQEVLTLIEKAVDKKAKVQLKNRRQGETNYTAANIQKAQQLLRYQPNIDIKKGIRDYCKWVLTNKKVTI